MKIVAVGGFGGPIHVLPDEGRTPLAGPFPTGAAARGWIVERIEQGLSPAKLEVWREVCRRNPPSSDMGREVFLVGLAAKGKSVEQISRYIPGDRRQTERRAHTQEAA